MDIIEQLKNKQTFLAAHYDLVQREYDEIADASPVGYDFPNFHLQVSLSRLKGEILMHQQTIQRLIFLYEHLSELRSQTQENPAAADAGQK